MKKPEMRQPLGVAALCAALLALAACSAGPRPALSDVYAAMAASAKGASREGGPRGFAGVREVGKYVKTALESDPSVRRARASAEAAGHRVGEVTQLDNPVLSLVPGTGAMTQTAAGEVDGSLGLSQRFPFPGKLRARGQGASQAAVESAALYRGVALATASSVRRAYYDLYFADRALELTRSSRKLLGGFRDIARRKYETGEVPQQDLLRAQVELANLDAELLELERARGTARAKLNRLMGREVTAGLPPTVAVEATARRLDRSGLFEEALRSSPAIAAARARVGGAEASLLEAKLAYAPDFTLSYTYTSVSDSGLSQVANGEDVERFAVALDLPLWLDRLHAGRRRARAELESSREALAAVRETTALAVEESLLAAESEQGRVELLRSVVLPQASQTLEATVSAYRAGQVDFLTMIENWRRLLDLEIAMQKSLTSLAAAIADLDEAVGRLPGPGSTNGG